MVNENVERAHQDARGQSTEDRDALAIAMSKSQIYPGTAIDVFGGNGLGPDVDNRVLDGPEDGGRMSLTLLLPVLGRPLFTLRTLWYLNSIRFPWPVIVADGNNIATLRRILLDGGHFPNLELEYFRRQDLDPRTYYRKCLTAVSMVQTPFVLIQDNDDFVGIGALRRMAAFLETHPDHSAVGGIVASFDVHVDASESMPFVQGTAGNWALRYEPKQLQQPLPSQRLAEHLRRYSPTYYSLHRQSALLAAYQFLVDSNVADLPLHEMLLSFHTLLTGKITSLCSTVGYYRQANTSESQAKVRRWSHRVLQESWQADFNAALTQFAASLQHAEPAFGIDATRQLLQDGIGWFLQTISDGTAMRAAPAGDFEALLRQLQGYGATSEDCAAIRDDLQPILDCLQGGEFRRFVSSVAPDLLIKWKVRQIPSQIEAAWKRVAAPRGRG